MAQRSESLRTPPFSAWAPRAPRLSVAARERWWLAFAPFSVPGLALLCLLIGHALFRGPLGLSGKTYDYAQYAVAGTLFPALLFGVPWFWRWRRLPWSARRPAGVALASLALVWCALFLVASVDKHGVRLMALPPLLALAQTVLMQRPWRPAEQSPQRSTAITVVAVVAWTLALSFLLEIFVQPPVYLAGFVAAFLLACGATWPGAATPERAARIALTRDAVAIAGIAFMSLRADGLFQAPAGELLGQGGLHHWAPWIGAAELMRDGGWLLWDVPSMYGFLSIVPLAHLPTSTPWQALYLLQAASFFVAGMSIYLIVRGLRPGWLTWFLAVSAAIAVPMVFATFDAGAPVGSIADYPNHGPYRYVWCLILIVVLLWERQEVEGARRRAIVAGGRLVWAVGVLWSPESAVYSSGVWLPAYAVIAFRAAAKSHHPWRTAASGIALPLGSLAACVGVVTAVYQSGLGRPPDWLAYLDYVRGLGLEVLVVVNDPTGSALGLLLGFCLLAISAWHLGFRRGAPTRSLPLLLGLMGGFWATGLYGFTRAYATLHPIAYVTLAVMLVTITRVGREAAWKPLVRAAAVPLLTLVLVSPLAAIPASPFAVGEAAAGVWRTARAGFAVEPLLPDADPELQSLMAEAGIGPDDPVSFLGSRLGILLPPWRPDGHPGAHRIVTTRDWLPAHPAVSLAYLPDDRGAAYLRRFIDRVQRGGWLVQHKTGDSAKPPNRHEVASGRQPWFFAVLSETHVPTRIVENDEWQLVWFDYVGRDSAVVRPAFLPDRGLPPLLPDVTIDGEPMARQSDPAVWVLPGEGLGWYAPAAGGRWIGPRAELWVYSRTATEVTLGLRPTPGAPPVLVAVGDSTAAPTREIALEPGWNRVEMCLWSRPVTDRADAAQARDSCAVQGMAALRPGFSPAGWFVTGIDLRTS